MDCAKHKCSNVLSLKHSPKTKNQQKKNKRKRKQPDQAEPTEPLLLFSLSKPPNRLNAGEYQVQLVCRCCQSIFISTLESHYPYF